MLSAPRPLLPLPRGSPGAGPSRSPPLPRGGSAGSRRTGSAGGAPRTSARSCSTVGGSGRVGNTRLALELMAGLWGRWGEGGLTAGTDRRLTPRADGCPPSPTPQEDRHTDRLPLPHPRTDRRTGRPTPPQANRPTPFRTDRQTHRHTQPQHGHSFPAPGSELPDKQTAGQTEPLTLPVEGHASPHTDPAPRTDGRTDRQTDTPLTPSLLQDGAFLPDPWTDRRADDSPSLPPVGQTSPRPRTDGQTDGQTAPPGRRTAAPPAPRARAPPGLDSALMTSPPRHHPRIKPRPLLKAPARRARSRREWIGSRFTWGGREGTRDEGSGGRAQAGVVPVHHLLFASCASFTAASEAAG